MTQNFYSPTMFVNYINYNRFITDEFNEKIFNLKKSEKTIVENLRIKKGLTHEEEYFKILKKKERVGRNPKTKEEFVITSRKVVSFTLSKKISDKLELIL